MYTSDTSRLLLLLLVGIVSCRDVSVYKQEDGSFSYKFDTLDKGSSAYSSYKDDLLKTGWSSLDIMSGYGSKLTDSEIAYCAGYAEGLLTAKDMWQQWQNVGPFFFAGKDKSVKESVVKFLKTQLNWMRDMSRKYQHTEPFWRQTGYIYQQFQGLYKGYAEIAKKEGYDADIEVPLMLNAVGDLLDLVHALNPKLRPKFDNMTADDIQLYRLKTGHCSALIKVLPGYENIYMAHSSWFVYAATNRIYKHYNFNMKDNSTASKKSSFSSYPGFLESLDDFYLLSSQLVMLQTTNNVFNTSLYEYVKPESLLAWQRVRVANAMAHSGQEWANVVKRYNSGTYNNQYMVIDLKKISLEKKISDGALWVVEQIPTYVASGDQTNVLRAGYWPSYNVPFYEKVFNMSGYPAMAKKMGTGVTYQLAPRAEIFRRDQTTVKDMDSFKAIMRYNDYKNDKYSGKDSCNTICCRGDLRKSASSLGCYDSKVTDFNMALKMKAYAINGPTRSHGLKAFSWTGHWKNESHKGLPQTYDFDWQLMKPAL